MRYLNSRNDETKFYFNVEIQIFIFMNDDYDDDDVVGHKKDEGFAFALVHSPFIVSLFASECYYSSIHVIGNCTY